MRVYFSIFYQCEYGVWVLILTNLPNLRSATLPEEGNTTSSTVIFGKLKSKIFKNLSVLIKQLIVSSNDLSVKLLWLK
ncbi:hypothetical protein EG351_05170 [Chryseobacterium bernardetii]|nr:hypothetical protein EG351_05170 [Chryseobacterium bernardetii]